MYCIMETNNAGKQNGSLFPGTNFIPNTRSVFSVQWIAVQKNGAKAINSSLPCRSSLQTAMVMRLCNAVIGR